jgi:RNA polymerase sigma-70 factor, ECF subfamily
MQTQSVQTGGDDATLVAGVLERDARAFELLFDRYADALRRHATYIVHDPASAHDVVQETFLRVWNRAAQWDGSGSFRAWLYGIATHLALNTLRTQSRHREVPLELPREPEDEDDPSGFVPAWAIDDASLGPEASAILAERRAACRQLVATLDEGKRKVIRLVHETGLNIREAADALDLPEGTVKSRLHYARKELASRWSEMGDWE